MSPCSPAFSPESCSCNHKVGLIFPFSPPIPLYSVLIFARVEAKEQQMVTKFHFYSFWEKHRDALRHFCQKPRLHNVHYIFYILHTPWIYFGGNCGTTNQIHSPGPSGPVSLRPFVLVLVTSGFILKSGVIFIFLCERVASPNVFHLRLVAPLPLLYINSVFLRFRLLCFFPQCFYFLNFFTCDLVLVFLTFKAAFRQLLNKWASYPEPSDPVIVFRSWHSSLLTRHLVRKHLNRMTQYSATNFSQVSNKELVQTGQDIWGFPIDRLWWIVSFWPSQWCTFRCHRCDLLWDLC